VALRYIADPAGSYEEPWLVAWTGAWMAVGAPRVVDGLSFGLAVLAASVPLLLAGSIAFGAWDVPLDLALAIVMTLALLPAGAVLGATFPSGTARATGAVAVGVLAFSLIGGADEDAAERPGETPAERSAVATVTDDAGRSGRQ
jgi:hypothetical protein